MLDFQFPQFAALFVQGSLELIRLARLGIPAHELIRRPDRPVRRTTSTRDAATAHRVQTDLMVDPAWAGYSSLFGLEAGIVTGGTKRTWSKGVFAAPVSLSFHSSARARRLGAGRSGQVHLKLADLVCFEQPVQVLEHQGLEAVGLGHVWSRRRWIVRSAPRLRQDFSQLLEGGPHLRLHGADRGTSGFRRSPRR